MDDIRDVLASLVVAAGSLADGVAMADRAISDFLADVDDGAQADVLRRLRAAFQDIRFEGRIASEILARLEVRIGERAF